MVMAAGMGTRFGGNKQLEPVGPNGEAFPQLSLSHAIDAGFNRCVMIVREEILDLARSAFEASHPGVEIAYVCQDTFGPSRPKPWGTTHAVLATEGLVVSNFALLNADDYYGASTFKLMAAETAKLVGDQCVVAGFELDKTVPASAQVTRAVLETTDARSDEVSSIVEHHDIGRNDGAIYSGSPKAELAPDTAVSMNFFGMTPQVFGHLSRSWTEFYSNNYKSESAELLIPDSLNQALADGLLQMTLTRTSAEWCGVTHREDLEYVQRTLRKLIG